MLPASKGNRGEVLDTNTKASRYEKEKESQEERRPNLQTRASPFARRYSIMK